jgi:hypothetical protein
MNAVSIPRWQQAQEAERAWWLDPAHAIERLQDRRDDAPWYAGLLNIAEHTVGGRRVLDIGGGPLPLSIVMEIPLEWLTVLDPCDYAPLTPELPRVTRIAEPAEWFKVDDGAYDECWGYNVLQHVIDPAAVMATAKKAARVVRWLDWTHTPIHQIHPHSIGPDWLRAQFDGWRITFDTEGSVTRPGWSHQFIAIVAERT